jgi:hypothetical protein
MEKMRIALPSGDLQVSSGNDYLPAHAEQFLKVADGVPLRLDKRLSTALFVQPIEMPVLVCS